MMELNSYLIFSVFLNLSGFTVKQLFLSRHEALEDIYIINMEACKSGLMFTGS